MHEIIAKIARHAFGKAAALGYAVLVAVAGNLAVNYVQQQNQAPAAPPAATAAKPETAAAPVAAPAVSAPEPALTAPPNFSQALEPA